LSGTAVNFSSSPVYALYANWTQNVSLPYGSTENLAYTTPLGPLYLPGTAVSPSKLSLTSQAFIPSLECEALNATVFPNILLDSAAVVSASAALSGGMCGNRWPNITWALDSIGVAQAPPNSTIEAVQAWRTDFKCRNGTGSSRPLEPGIQWPATPVPADPDGFVIVTSSYRYWANVSGDSLGPITISGSNESDAMIVIFPLNVIACKPSYQVGSVNVTAIFSPNNTQVPASVDVGEPFDLLPGGIDDFSGSDLVKAFESTFLNAKNFFGQSYPSLSGTTVEVPSINDTFLVLATMALDDPPGNMSTLLEPDNVIKGSRQAFAAVMAGFGNQVLLSDSTQETLAEVTTPVSRLFPSVIVTGFMIAIFAILAISSALLSFYWKSAFLAASPGSVGFVAFSLGSSPLLKPLLCHTGHLSDKDLQSRLAERAGAELGSSEHRADSNLGDEHRHKSDEGSETDLDIDSFAWWHPLISRWWSLSSITLLITALITVLEILQHISDANQGLSFASNKSAARIVTRIIPALLTITIATFAVSLDSAIITLAPFSALRRGGVAPATLCRNLLGTVTPERFLISVRMGYWNVVFSSLGSIVSAFLTVAVSGLYIVGEVPYDARVTARPLDFFNPASVSEGYNNGGVIFSLLERDGMPYPPHTFDELVLPKLTVRSDGSETLSGADGPVSVQIPTLRATLECYPVAESNISLTNGYTGFCYSRQSNGGSVSITAKTIARCQNGSIDWNATPEDGWGTFSTGSPGEWWGDVRSEPVQNLPCLSFSYFFEGYFGCAPDNNMTGLTPSNVTILRCSQLIQTVSAIVTYTDSTLTTIDETQPPKIDNSTASLVANANSTFANYFPFDLKTPLDDEFRLWKPNNATTDAFSQVLVYGAGAPPLSQLVGRENQHNLNQAVLRVYRRAMAQFLNSGARVPCNATTTPPPSSWCQQTFTVSGKLLRDRVLQDQASKIALQALLAATLVCGALAVLLTRNRNVLSHNPYSIAGMAGLVADSRLVTGFEELIGAGMVDKKSEKGLKNALERLGRSYSLGLWPGVSGQPPFYGIDIDGA